jgi:ribosomal protein L37E
MHFIIIYNTLNLPNLGINMRRSTIMIKLIKSLFNALFATKLIRCQRCGHEYPESYNSCPIADCGTPKLMKFSGNSHDRRKKRRELKKIAALCVFSQLTLY